MEMFQLFMQLIAKSGSFCQWLWCYETREVSDEKYFKTYFTTSGEK